ncbi:MAG: glycosyl transferase group 1 [Pseudanabaena sp.]|nr:MAG: glycosyl transferase group 1 [Pseudanabaena sp.]
MRIIIVRRVRGSTPSIDIYTDNLVAGLKTVRPAWTIIEIEPKPWNSPDKLWMSGSGLRKYYECYWRYPREVRQQQADIFHIVDHTDAHIARCLNRARQSTVVTCHDLVQLIYPERQSRFPALSLSVWRHSVQGMRQANHIVAVSSNTAKDIQQFLNIPSENITVALNGVEPQFRVLPRVPVVSLRQQYTPSPETICLLNVGGTHQRKNMLTILKVVESLRTKGLSVCLWKTGGQFTPEHKAFINEHQLDRHVIHFGNPDKETLVCLYNAADILLSPSLYEGFGLTIVEAMACGTPVITSNVSSLPEVVCDAAILVDPLNVEAITEAVCQIKQDPSYCNQLIEKGLLRAKFFNWQKNAEQVAKVYENLVLKKSSQIVE